MYLRFKWWQSKPPIISNCAYVNDSRLAHGKQLIGHVGTDKGSHSRKKASRKTVYEAGHWLVRPGELPRAVETQRSINSYSYFYSCAVVHDFRDISFIVWRKRASLKENKENLENAAKVGTGNWGDRWMGQADLGAATGKWYGTYSI